MYPTRKRSWSPFQCLNWTNTKTSTVHSQWSTPQRGECWLRDANPFLCAHATPTLISDADIDLWTFIGKNDRMKSHRKNVSMMALIGVGTRAIKTKIWPYSSKNFYRTYWQWLQGLKIPGAKAHYPMKDLCTTRKKKVTVSGHLYKTLHESKMPKTEKPQKLLNSEVGPLWQIFIQPQRRFVFVGWVHETASKYLRWCHQRRPKAHFAHSLRQQPTATPDRIKTNRNSLQKHREKWSRRDFCN